MNCRIEQTNTFGRKLHIDIPATDFSTQINLKIRKLSTTARIKGFRPGKVPIEVVKRYYGEDIAQEVANTMILESYKEAIAEHSYQSVITPLFEEIEIDKDKGISYTAHIEVIPDLQLVIDGLTVDKPTCEITEADIDTMVERVRKNQAKWQAKTSAAANGDRLTIDIKMLAAQDAVPQEMVDQSIILGSHFLGKNFDRQLENVCAGEERVVQMESFATDERVAANADGKQYQVHIKQVEEEILPELDNDFFNACGVKEGGLDALRGLLRDGMEWELNKKLKELYKENIENAVLEYNQIEPPPLMLKEHIESLREKLSKNDTIKERASDAFYEKIASSQVRLRVIFLYFSDKYSIEASRRDCDAKIAELAVDYSEPEKVISHYNKNAKAYESIQSMVIEDKMMDLLMEKVSPSEKKHTYYEIVDSKSTVD